jgi:hypothetical protein
VELLSPMMGVVVLICEFCSYEIHTTGRCVRESASVGTILDAEWQDHFLVGGSGLLVPELVLDEELAFVLVSVLLGMS